MKLTKKILALLLTLVLSLGMFTACVPTDSASSGDSQPAIAEDGSYTSKDEVALYIHTYGHLPENYITKDEAYDLGWKSEGTLDEVAPGMSIGGDYYGNYEGVLPDEPGREYHECDIDYESGNRNGKRIVYSNDGNIYYTEDHYNSFEHLYGDDE
jgi:ribonuclease T1